MPHKIYTWIGLLITYVTLPLTGIVFKRIFGEQMADGPFIAKELINLGMVGVLFWIILCKEKLPLSSIGISKKNWKETNIGR